MSIARVPNAAMIRICKAFKEDKDNDGGGGAYAGPSGYAIRTAWASLYEEIGVTEELAVDGRPFHWHCISFSKALQRMATESPLFTQALKQIWLRRPCTAEAPFQIVFYADEVTPGTLLKPDNKRKIWCFYVSIKELGPSLLKHEAVWIPLACLRSTIAGNLSGGASEAFGVLLRRMFVEEDVSRRGVCIHAHSFVAVFFFKLGLVVADADGHRALWSLKGAAGKLPCGMCLNVMNDPDLPAGMVGLNCSDPSQFRFATSADLWRKADMLHAYVGISTKAFFQDLEKATGLHYQEKGVLWDVALREHVPVGDVFCYDPMHVLVANGLAQTEVDHVLAALEASGVSINDVHKFMAVGWQFCRVLGSERILLACFAPPRLRAFRGDGHFRTQASEMLVLFPVLCNFMSTVIRSAGTLDLQVDSFEALARVLYLSRLGKEGTRAEAELASAIEQHSLLSKRAYGADVKPKAHFIHHLPLQLKSHGFLLDCFVGERKHRGVKQIAGNVLNTKVFEQSVILPFIGQQFADLESRLADGLLKPSPCQELMQELDVKSAYVDKQLRFQGTDLFRHDLLHINGSFVMAQCFVEADGSFFVLGQPHRKLSDSGLAVSLQPLVDELVLEPLKAGQWHFMAAWREASAGGIVALRG